MYRCEHITCNLDQKKDKLVCVACHGHMINPSRVTVEVRCVCVCVCVCACVCDALNPSLVVHSTDFFLELATIIFMLEPTLKGYRQRLIQT